MMAKNWLSCVAICCVLLVTDFQGKAQSINIDLAIEHQTIDGFGGINFPGWIPDLNEDQREKAFGNDPGELGLSILRVHVDPNPEMFGRELPTATHAKEKGAIIFASPWNPPADLLDPAAEQNRIPYEMYDEYVDHLNAFNTFMEDNDVPLYAISVQNEPDYGEWTRWTSEEMLIFMKEFAQDIDNRVIAPESFQFIHAFSDPLLNDATASANLDIMGGHIYGGGNVPYPLAEAKGKPIWMTEHYTSSDRSANLWPDALDVGTEINQSMKSNFNAYVWWYIRRFYGLMTDDGNISKRGYVMSHFSKFVRPNSVRVEAAVSGVALVHATAYKTDTSLAIVVVNDSEESQEITFSIENSTFNSLAKFTTSASKNVVNDGLMEITGGTFTTTLEPKSISTFTSSPEAGGKQNNIAPVAKAGDDLDIEDPDGDGFETIMLDGSGSTDADGLITNYSWASNEEQLAWTATDEISLPIGDHVLVLTVTDNDGARHADTLNISVQGIYNTELWFEAECGEAGASWEILGDPEAANSKYVATPTGTMGAAPTDDKDILQIQFTLTEATNYKIWGRVIAPSADDDSYWVKVDDTDWVNWNGIPAGTDWHWDDVHDASNDNPMVYQLDAGEHTLSIGWREDGALLDKILISNTGITPTGAGGVDDTCVTEEPEPQPTAIGNDEKQSVAISVYPNPAQSDIAVRSKTPFNTLVIYSIEGKKLIEEHFDIPVSEKRLLLNLESGLYFIHVYGKSSKGIVKVILE